MTLPNLQWEDWLVVAVTGAYVAVAFAGAFKQDWPKLILFGGYAFANVGAIWAMLK